MKTYQFSPKCKRCVGERGRIWLRIFSRVSVGCCMLAVGTDTASSSQIALDGRTQNTIPWGALSPGGSFVADLVAAAPPLRAALPLSTAGLFLRSAPPLAVVAVVPLRLQARRRLRSRVRRCIRANPYSTLAQVVRCRSWRCVAGLTGRFVGAVMQAASPVWVMQPASPTRVEGEPMERELSVEARLALVLIERSREASEAVVRAIVTGAVQPLVRDVEIAWRDWPPQ